MIQGNLRSIFTAARKLLLAAFLASILLSMLSFGRATAAPLRYAPKANEKFAYKVEITADMPDKIETSNGTISYEVKSIGNALKFDYSGGLHRTTKAKESAHIGFAVPVFPPDFGFGSIHRGLGHTTNRISLTPRGEVNSLEGTSQLPYLLGNLSLLIFEPLAEKDQKTWTSDKGISVSETKSSRFPRPPSFWHGNRPERTTTGSESSTFTHQSDKGDIAIFRKTYHLQTAKEKKSFAINANGTWTFNRRRNMPQSLDCKYNIVYKDDNVTTNIPVTVKYNLLSEEELAKYEKEQEELRKKTEAEHKKLLAEQKAPITPEERRRILKELKTNDRHQLLTLLGKLAQKEPREDQVIAKAIMPLLKHSSSMVSSRAADALIKFAPELEQKIKINKEYSRSGSVEVTGPPIAAHTSLPPGLIVAVNDFGPWYKAAKVIRKHKDGQIELEIVGRSGRTKTFPWSKIRLAPPEVDQPFVSKRMLASVYRDEKPSNDGDDEDSDDEDGDEPAFGGKTDRGYRTWTDDSGTFAIVAKYIKFDGERIVLQRKKDGREIPVPISRLSEADREVAQRLMKEPKPSNPFE
ncbi:MAG: hypothetical protein JXM70_06030 [Pirellulales bacterium]|nr:hypothetical protein [Pirellulales bacterium]